MFDILSHLFAAVCGQNPGHTWAPGGMLLPCCQRCTGLYVGAGVAAVLHLWLRPKLSARFLEIHGAFLLAMVPLGFHWLAQGPILRTASGVLYGSGVVTFLWLPLASRFTFHVSTPSTWGYFLILSATVVSLPMLAGFDGTFAAYAVSGLIAWGALALLALVVADFSLGIVGFLRRLRRLTSPRVPA